MPSRHGQNTRDAPRRPPRSSKRRSSERIGVSDSRELEPESRHGSDRESRRIARQKSSWPQQLPLLIVCSMCLTGLIGLVTMHAALQNTHHNTWIERSRNLFQRRAASPEEGAAAGDAVQEERLQRAARGGERDASRVAAAAACERGSRFAVAAAPTRRSSRHEHPQQQPPQQARARQQPSTAAYLAAAAAATTTPSRRSHGALSEQLEVEEAGPQAQPGYQYEEHHSTHTRGGGVSSSSSRASHGASSASASSHHLHSNAAEVVPHELVADMYDLHHTSSHHGAGGGGGGGEDDDDAADGLDSTTADSFGHGSRAQVDAILEEAVQSLPDELPFQQVDRIEYMNAQREHALSASAASAASASATATARLAKLRGEARGSSSSSISTAHAAEEAEGGGGGIASMRSSSRASARSSSSSISSSSSGSTGAFNVTLVTQTDTSRLHYLSECAARWRGPIAAAVLLPPGDDLESALDGRSFEPHVRLLPMASDHSSLENGTYPINTLRNLAIRSVTTTHFVVLDVDLWPSSSLHDSILSSPSSLLRSKYAALVIPAFQLDLPPPPGGSDDDAAAGFFEASFDRVPSTMNELRSCVSAKQCGTFYHHSSPETHATTPYKDWWEVGDSGPHEPLPIPCFRSARYEPYVVLPNLPSTPIYSEAFTGYGKNKIELVTHLRFAGFRFYALPRAFVTHMPHVKSQQKVLWEQSSHRGHMDRLYQRLVAQLITRFKRPRTPSCHPGRLL